MDFNNWATIVVVLGLIAGIYGFNTRNKKTRKFVWLGGIFIVAGVLAFAGVTQVGFLMNPITGSTLSLDDNVGGQTTSTVFSSTLTAVASGQDAQALGTQVGNSLLTSFNDGVYGTSTTTVPGQKISLVVVNNTLYHNAFVDDFTVSTNSFPLNVKFNKNATVSETIFNTNGVATTNNGGTQNQTALGNGYTYTLKDAMIGTALQSTQDMTCVVELTAGVNATSSPPGVGLSLNGASIPLKGTSVPAWYTPQGVNSRVWLFDIAPLTTGAQVDYYINLNSLSTGQFGTASKLIKTCYTKEYFVDANTGKATYDVADSNNAIKSMASYARTLVFQ